MHRALDERYLRGTPVPESFTTTTRCPSLAGELAGASYAVTALRAAERWSPLATIPYGLIGIGLAGLLAVTSFVNADEGWQWILALVFLAAAMGIVWAWAGRVVSAVRFFRLPQAVAERWSDVLVKEAIGVYFHDLYVEGYLPRAWFHDTFCRDQPIGRAAFEPLGTPTLPRAILIHTAMRRFPALRQSQRRQEQPPAGRRIARAPEAAGDPSATRGE